MSVSKPAIYYLHVPIELHCDVCLHYHEHTLYFQSHTHLPAATMTHQSRKVD